MSLVSVYNNIDQTNANLETLNDNIINQSHKDAENQKELASIIQLAFGFLLLSIGLLTSVKYLGMLIEENGKRKNESETDDNVSLEHFADTFTDSPEVFSPSNVQNPMPDNKETITSDSVSL